MRYIKAISIIGIIIGSAYAQTIGIFAGTIDDSPICAMTMDEITRTLGRPSGVVPSPAVAADLIGPKLYFAESGLGFWFYPTGSAQPGTEQVLVTTIYLSRAWNDDTNEWLMPFSGALQPAANANWHLDRTTEELSDRDVTIVTPQDTQDSLRDIGITPTGPFNYTVRTLGLAGETINFQHEEVTRFLERVTIACP